MFELTTVTGRKLAALVLAGALTGPITAAAQGHLPNPAQATTSSAAAQQPKTREEVRRETERAMRDGTWRCRTNSRGWCSADPDFARQPAGRDSGH